MSDPREQAIEEAVKAVRARPVVARAFARQIAVAAIDAYESARARIDGAKMMPREIDDAQRIAAVNTTLPGIGEPPLYEKLYRAMHDAKE